jgi:hypothetical protein
MMWMPAVPYCCRYDWSCTRVLVKDQSPLQLVGIRVQMIDARPVLKELHRRMMPWTSKSLESRSSARHDPSWPVIPGISPRLRT